jgi:hypothetical protein
MYIRLNAGSRAKSGMLKVEGCKLDASYGKFQEITGELADTVQIYKRKQ